MIHPDISKTGVAVRYYEVVHPERNYQKHQALRQFRQDRAIDLKVLKSVIREIFKEQMKLL